MKKSFIALAVASALTVTMVAQGDTTLFGSAGFDVNGNFFVFCIRDNSSNY